MSGACCGPQRESAGVSAPVVLGSRVGSRVGGRVGGRLDAGDLVDLVELPGGTFLMGSEDADVNAGDVLTIWGLVYRARSANANDAEKLIIRCVEEHNNTAAPDDMVALVSDVKVKTQSSQKLGPGR